ncbi:hypothetical protein MTO96_031148 [Rhipicephalus appendiculatus]
MVRRSKKAPLMPRRWIRSGTDVHRLLTVGSPSTPPEYYTRARGAGHLLSGNLNHTCPTVMDSARGCQNAPVASHPLLASPLGLRLVPDAVHSGPSAVSCALISTSSRRRSSSICTEDFSRHGTPGVNWKYWPSALRCNGRKFFKYRALLSEGGCSLSVMTTLPLMYIDIDD